MCQYVPTLCFPTSIVLNTYMTMCICVVPIVVIKAPDEQVAGQPLKLKCQINAVTDIDSTVDIIWTSGNTEVRKVENTPGYLISNYSDGFTAISSLSRHDNNREYKCEVIINTSPPVKAASDKITLDVIREFRCMPLYISNCQCVMLPTSMYVHKLSLQIKIAMYEPFICKFIKPPLA